MKNKMKFFNWFKPRNWGWMKVYRDLENFADWKRIIKREESDPNSKFSKWKLQRTKLYDVYIIITLDESDIPLPELVKRTKVLESLNPLNRYLDEELGFAECLNCEFNQFEDDQGIPTLSYLIVYRFNFNKFSIKWLSKFIFVNIILLILILKLHLISLLISWISSLI
jgi:hypothetical protein